MKSSNTNSRISKEFKRSVIGRTWQTERKVLKTVRFSRVVRKHQIETVTPLLVLECYHSIPAKSYSGEFCQKYAYCKTCFEKGITRDMLGKY